VQASCYTAICTSLSDRFGTRFWVQNTGGSGMTMMARLEGSVALVITDCEDTLSPVAWHREGRARGFYVRVYRTTLDAEAADVDWPESSPARAARSPSRPLRLSATSSVRHCGMWPRTSFRNESPGQSGGSAAPNG